MGPIPPGVFKPLSQAEVDELMKKYAGKEHGVGLDDVFTAEEIEHAKQLSALAVAANHPNPVYNELAVNPPYNMQRLKALAEKLKQKPSDNS